MAHVLPVPKKRVEASMETQSMSFGRKRMLCGGFQTILEE